MGALQTLTGSAAGCRINPEVPSGKQFHHHQG